MMPEEEDGAPKLRHSKKTSVEKIEKRCITTLRMFQVPLQVEEETGKKVSNFLILSMEFDEKQVHPTNRLGSDKGRRMMTVKICVM